MKRALVIIPLILLVIICGCGSETKTSIPQSRQPTTHVPTTHPTAEPEAEPEPAPTPATTPTPATSAPVGIPWDQAKYHIGERTTVYGPVVSTKWASRSKGQPTFLNIGNPYPDENRFTVVIWIENRGNFPFAPEDYYYGKTISVTGLITSYKGVPEIEVTSPSQIQVW